MRTLITLALIATTATAQSRDDKRRYMGPAFNGIFRIQIYGNECTWDSRGRQTSCQAIVQEVTGFAVQTDRKGRTLVATVGHGFEPVGFGSTFTTTRIVATSVTGKRYGTVGINGKGFLYDKASDFGAIAIKHKAEPYRTSSPRAGEPVDVYGWPKLYVLKRRYRVANKRGRVWKFDALTREATNSGFSGGPVVNSNGHAIGMVQGGTNGKDEFVAMDKYREWIKRQGITLRGEPATKAPSRTLQRTQYAKREQRAFPVETRPVPFSEPGQMGGVPAPAPDPVSVPRPNPVNRPQAIPSATPWPGTIVSQSCEERRRICMQAWACWIDQRIKAQMRSGPAGPAGADGARGKSAYDIAVEMGFRGSKGQWLQSLRGPAGRNGTNGKNGSDGASAPAVDLQELAAILARNHAEAIRGQDGLPGTNGTNGSDGTSVTPDELRPIIREIAQSIIDSRPRRDIVIPEPAELDRIVDAWVAANSDRINARIDARVNEILQGRVAAARTATVMIIDSSKDATNPRIVSEPIKYELDKEPIILDMAEFVRRD